MSEFFPEKKPININREVELLAFECQDTIFQLASIAPGAIFPLHQHLESQIGMIFNGNLEMNINGNKTIIQPLDHVYIAGANIPHGSANLLQETILGFDVKRIINHPVSGQNESAFVRVTPSEINGLSDQSVTGSWFKISIQKIPSGFTIPKHQWKEEEIGFILNGQFNVTIESEEQCLQYGQIYYAPPKALHKGYNSSEQEISLVRIWI